MHFGETNEHGVGIKSGLGTCFCTDAIKCSCGSNLFKNQNDYDSMNMKKKGIKVFRASSSDICGQTCIIEVIAISSCICVVIVGFYIGWRYRIVSRTGKIDEIISNRVNLNTFTIYNQPKLCSVIYSIS